MSGRLKGQVETIIVQAHWCETFARTEKLKPVDFYLQAIRREQGRGDQSAAVAAMLDRRIARMAREKDREESR